MPEHPFAGETPEEIASKEKPKCLRCNDTKKREMKSRTGKVMIVSCSCPAPAAKNLTEKIHAIYVEGNAGKLSDIEVEQAVSEAVRETVIELEGHLERTIGVCAKILSRLENVERALLEHLKN